MGISRRYVLRIFFWPICIWGTDLDVVLVTYTAVVLSSPLIRDYMINFAKNVMFSTSMPYTDIYALEACLSVVSSVRGQQV